MQRRTTPMASNNYIFLDHNPTSSELSLMYKTIDDAIAGDARMVTVATEYLPRLDNMSGDRWANRLRFAPFPDHTAKVLSSWQGALHRKKHNVVLPPRLQQPMFASEGQLYSHLTLFEQV